MEAALTKPFHSFSSQLLFRYPYAILFLTVTRYELVFDSDLARKVIKISDDRDNLQASKLCLVILSITSKIVSKVIVTQALHCSFLQRIAQNTRSRTYPPPFHVLYCTTAHGLPLNSGFRLCSTCTQKQSISTSATIRSNAICHSYTGRTTPKLYSLIIITSLRIHFKFCVFSREYFLDQEGRGGYKLQNSFIAWDGFHCKT